MSENSPAAPAHRNGRRLAVIALAGAGLAIAAAVWAGNAGTPAAAECPVQAEAASRIDMAAVGELAALGGTGEGRGHAQMAFEDENGNALTLADFKGRKLLINFWASWCVPCREEMPALDALADRHNSDDFLVLPINLDIGADGLDKARAFLEEGGFTHLPLYADPSFAVFDRLKTQAVAVGLPATILVDEDGCELAVLQGPAEWDSPDGDRVIEALLGA
ncbi:TlpA family protein disulfide reductase [Arsenicitalea aurantiaca]|uniref:TlpA family protein disulfide reductase n=1 Tax=Arsenicitalea aurantiaca TaxID=1783274 RepID=A0A433X5R7_9HYPH|nr:TlpA disulfide reductase family protein [Arsenicitalea aurantiaca]RUT29430.1 TlpA family protein disulfide reductase [Arsenicitalea aurantiaca]